MQAYKSKPSGQNLETDAIYRTGMKEIVLSEINYETTLKAVNGLIIWINQIYIDHGEIIQIYIDHGEIRCNVDAQW